MKLKPGLEERITSHERKGPFPFHFASESNISDKEERFRERAFLMLCQPHNVRLAPSVPSMLTSRGEGPIYSGGEEKIRVASDTYLI